MIGLADVIAMENLVDQSPEMMAAGRAVGSVLIFMLEPPRALSELAATLLAAWHWLLPGGLCMGIFALALYQLFDRTEVSRALAPSLALMAEAALLGVSLNRAVRRQLTDSIV